MGQDFWTDVIVKVDFKTNIKSDIISLYNCQVWPNSWQKHSCAASGQKLGSLKISFLVKFKHSYAFFKFLVIGHYRYIYNKRFNF